MPGDSRPKTMKALKAMKHQDDLARFMESLSLEMDEERMVFHQDHVYYLPEGLEWNLPLRFLRTGLFLGEVKKGRFEPSQALAMALKADQFDAVVRLGHEDERVVRYLKGETVELSEAEGPIKGWCLVAMEDYPMGWAKGCLLYTSSQFGQRSPLRLPHRDQISYKVGHTADEKQFSNTP